LVRAEVARDVGPWDERFFLYSEEVDYCRRIRELGWRIQFVPQAAVVHRGGGSGTSPELDTLMAVNKVRYIEKWHSPLYALAFRSVMVLGTLLRWSKPGRHHRLAALVDRSKWADLPQAMKPARPLDDRAGAVIVPAHNE
ncbi:glycosyltransferase family 2 protein, partial [Streptomyces sp. SID10244]|nr:glycosyltransferase family 2 protein [Streptomyces sp. SID10244]